VTIASTRCARLALCLAAAAALWPWAAAAQGAASRRDRPAQVRDVRRTRLSEAVRMTIELDREVPYRSERLDGPPRLVFDFLGARPAASLVEGSLSYHEDVVRYVRIGRHPNDVTRVVFDLAGVRRYSVFALYDPYRLVIDCVRETPAVGAAAKPERVAAPPAVPDARRAAPPSSVAATPPSAAPRPAIPSPAPAAPTQTERVHEPPLAPADVEHEPAEVVMFSRRLRVTSAMLPEAPLGTRVDLPGNASTADVTEAPAALPARNERPPAAAEAEPPARDTGDKPIPPVPLKNGFSLARQLGLGATRIVIDAGHGGRDPGAQARGGSEAAIVLDIALRLEKLLKAAGLDVVLTRRTNRYVALEERTQVANQAGGDLFLSIHANSSRNARAQGVETYVLNFASNPEAEAVAARENAASERTMSSLNGLLQAIALNNKLDESRGFAASVQNALVRRLRTSHRQLKDLGVKQAPFVVLIGAEMPSVLVEVSFISHQQEGRLLRTPSYRQKVADALFEGIRGYQKSLKRAMVSRE
jgi:N-acetylmuramoyl-L-alanine amidase